MGEIKGLQVQKEREGGREMEGWREGERTDYVASQHSSVPGLWTKCFVQ